ncbi:MAG TPA: FAD/NAD(P)-binding oxidoreductase [Gammaproteobacteria bacterium]|nr:FAD/NAD(P)-binding oxidoreductase [Gammaproteobacteria bacterium]
MNNVTQIVIVGGGTAGITVAAMLSRKSRGKDCHITIIEPSDVHYYQPALTLVGAGVSQLDHIHRPEEKLIPTGVEWIQKKVSGFHPEQNRVALASGSTVLYDYLVVCPGLELNWEKIRGAKETLGRNGVCSNYSPDYVIDTWDEIQNLKPGATAVFTQPPLPFKCPGAPQKIVYLAADYLRKKNILDKCKLHFMLQSADIFAVPFFARELRKVAARYDINVHYQHDLIAVDGNSRKATFIVVGGKNKGKKVTVEFDMLHITPPQSPPEIIRTGPLANEAGYVDVDQGTLQHKKFPNIYGLGDACSTPNSKTAAAVRLQAPVVVENILAMTENNTPSAVYDGYASCPLTTAYNKVIMAEFCYGGKVTPTFPLDPSKERWINWFIKTTALPLFYWFYMLKGFNRFFKHNTDYVEPAE